MSEWKKIEGVAFREYRIGSDGSLDFKAEFESDVMFMVERDERPAFLRFAQRLANGELDEPATPPVEEYPLTFEQAVGKCAMGEIVEARLFWMRIKNYQMELNAKCGPFDDEIGWVKMQSDFRNEKFRIYAPPVTPKDRLTTLASDFCRQNGVAATLNTMDGLAMTRLWFIKVRNEAIGDCWIKSKEYVHEYGLNGNSLEKELESLKVKQ